MKKMLQIILVLFVVQSDRSEHGGKFQLVQTKQIIDKLSFKSREILANEKYKIIVEYNSTSS